MDVLTRLVLIIGWIVFSSGCSSSSKTFVSLGDGSAVPAESLDTLARERGITREQALKQLRVESAEKRVTKHAEKYGITEDEARKQLAFADEHETIPYLAGNRREAAADLEQK